MQAAGLRAGGPRRGCRVRAGSSGWGGGPRRGGLEGAAQRGPPCLWAPSSGNCRPVKRLPQRTRPVHAGSLRTGRAGGRAGGCSQQGGAVLSPGPMGGLCVRRDPCRPRAHWEGRPHGSSRGRTVASCSQRPPPHPPRPGAHSALWPWPAGPPSACRHRTGHAVRTAAAQRRRQGPPGPTVTWRRCPRPVPTPPHARRPPWGRAQSRSEGGRPCGWGVHSTGEPGEACGWAALEGPGGAHGLIASAAALSEPHPCSARH